MDYHLIVCCVKSKHVKGPSFQSVKQGSLEQVHRQWCERLTLSRAIGPTRSAQLLYKGAVWKSYLDVYKELPCPKRLWIISAGYGLLSGQDELSGYAATFQNDSDSIYGHIEGETKAAETAQAWWAAITQYPPLKATGHPSSLSELMQTYSKDNFVMVASKAYLTAVWLDLAEGLNKLSDPSSLLLVSNSKDLQTLVTVGQCPGLLPYVPGAERTLKCSKLTVNSQLANYLMRRVMPEKGWNHGAFAKAVSELEVNEPEVPKRAKLTDEDVQELIMEYLQWVGKPSKSAALQFVRNQGKACEQKRFGELFKQVLTD